MANEATYSSFETNGGRVGALLSALVDEALYDPTDLRVCMIQVPWDQIGSDTLDVAIDAAPGAFAANSSETSFGGTDPSAYTTSKFQLVPAGYTRVYQPTDLFALTGGPIDVERMARNLSLGVGLTITDMLAAAFPSITQNVTDTGVDMTVDDIYTGLFTLNLANVEVSAEQPAHAVLWNAHFNDFQASLRGEAGANQWTQQTADMLAAKGRGYKGRWNNVEFYQSDSCSSANAGADKVSALFGYGAYKYAIMPVRRIVDNRMIPAANIYMESEQLLIEIVRDGVNSMSKLVGHMYPAVSAANVTKACKLVFDL